MQNESRVLELVGMSKQRMGSVSHLKLQQVPIPPCKCLICKQSLSLFAAHEYVLGQFYQANYRCIFAYREFPWKNQLYQSYITSEGQSAFCKSKWFRP
jgi:hypothetical protein